MKRRKIEAEELLQQFEKGSLRILFLYPFRVYKDFTSEQWDKLQQTTKEDVLIFLEESTTPKLFSSNVWNFLSNLKNAALEQPM